MNASSFLGSGWSFPPSFSQGGDDVMLETGHSDIEQSLKILLTTQIGERIMREDYGCSLADYHFEIADHNMFRGVESLIRDAIKKYEPRISVEEFDISEEKSLEGKFLIMIDYKVRTTNSRHNMVFPFYINEATQPTDLF